MELLERYLRQIRRYLPLKERDETIEELRSLILDQLDQKDQKNDPEESLKDILIEMGEPQKVALRYNDKGPLISNEMEPIMILVMKIVSITLPLVILFAESIGFVTGNPNFTFVDFLLNIAYGIPGAMYALVVAIGTVFIVFILIERYVQPQFHVEEKPFNPDLLPELPVKALRVSVPGSIIVILILVAMLYIVNLNQGVIGVYLDNVRYPLLNENFDKILPFLNITWFVTILLNVYYLYTRKKNIPSKTIELINEIFSAVIIILIATSDVFNDVIIDGYNLNIIPSMIKYILIFVGIAAIIGHLFDYIKMYINIEQLDRIEKK